MRQRPGRPIVAPAAQQQPRRDWCNSIKPEAAVVPGPTLPLRAERCSNPSVDILVGEYDTPSMNGAWPTTAQPRLQDNASMDVLIQKGGVMLKRMATASVAIALAVLVFGGGSAVAAGGG